MKEISLRLDVPSEECCLETLEECDLRDSLRVNGTILENSSVVSVGYFFVREGKDVEGNAIIFVRSLVVKKNWKKMGYGRSLLDLASDIGKYKGYKWLYVCINEALDKNNLAEFYTHLGFYPCLPYSVPTSIIPVPSDSQYFRRQIMNR